MKRFMTSIVVTIMLLTTGGTVLASQTETIDVIATNKKVDFNYQYDGVRVGKPFIENSRTFIPLRIVSEDLGYKVDWDGTTQTAIVSKGSNEVKIKIGDNFALVNGVKTYIDIQDGKPVNTRAQLKDSRTYVPVRFISEAMGDKVEYRQPSTSSVKNKIIYINSSNIPEEQSTKSTVDDLDPSTWPVPKGAALIEVSQPYGEYVYQYNATLPNGGSIGKVIAKNVDPRVSYVGGFDSNGKSFVRINIDSTKSSKKYPQISLHGTDNKGQSYIARYTKDGSLSFIFIGGAPSLTEKDHDALRSEAKKFIP